MPSSPAIDAIRPSDLPAPPQVALEILRACSNDDVDSRTLASFAETDPVLTAELLRVVNTPLFGIGKEVTSVRHAVTLLGSRSLRNIILCLMVREAAQNYARENFDITLFWGDSLNRAVAASMIAKLCHLDKDEAFTASIMQDFGLLILFYLNPNTTMSYSELRQYDPQQRLEKEMVLFGLGHDELVCMLAKNWSLPEGFILALSSHHRIESNSTTLTKILCCVDWISAVFSVQDINRVLQPCCDIAKQLLDIKEYQIEEVFVELPAQVEQAAHAMGLRIQQPVDFENLLRQANSVLAKENVSYQELTWELEKAIADRDRLSAELDREIAIAQEVQRKLMPDIQVQDGPVYGLNLPARQVSGDFYDFVYHSSGSIWFTVGDVSGKGINAGLTMAKTVSLFHCLAKHTLDPEKLIYMINNEICESATRGYFVTMVLGIYNPADKIVRLVNAGHLPVLVDDCEKGILSYTSTGQPIGILPDTDYKTCEPISLQKGALYLYSDGVTESRMENGEMLREQGFIDLIAKHRTKPAQDRLDAIVDEVLTETTLHDDLTLLLFEPK